MLNAINTTPLLRVKNLSVKAEEKRILQDVHLTIDVGEIHFLQGANGAGKSTLGHVLAGDDGYVVEGGEMLFNGKDLADMSPEARSHTGLFMAFQQPIEIPGVSHMQFLQTMIEAQRKAGGQEALQGAAYLKRIQAAMGYTGWDNSFLGRCVHENFSGGEKKRSELLQLVLLAPKLAILDEIDSGLDESGRLLMVRVVKSLQAEGCAFLIITHYDSLLEAFGTHKVHTLEKGSLVSSTLKTIG